MPEQHPGCPDCPFTLTIDVEAGDEPIRDGRLVRLKIYKAQVILTRKQFIEGLRLGKALMRYEEFRQRTPLAEEPRA